MTRQHSCRVMRKICKGRWNEYESPIEFLNCDGKIVSKMDPGIQIEHVYFHSSWFPKFQGDLLAMCLETNEQTLWKILTTSCRRDILLVFCLSLLTSRCRFLHLITWWGENYVFNLFFKAAINGCLFTRWYFFQSLHAMLYSQYCLCYLILMLKRI